MQFQSHNLQQLMAVRQATPQETAEQQNLCLEERTSSERQVSYEQWAGNATNWDDWRGAHNRYVEDQVRRRHPLSTAFTLGEPSLLPDIESNQYLLRLERIDGVLHKYSQAQGVSLIPNEINRWITAVSSNKAAPSQKTARSFSDLGTLLLGATNITPEAALLAELTDFLNQERRDGRPSFVAFDAEFPDLLGNSDWLGRYL